MSLKKCSRQAGQWTSVRPYCLEALSLADLDPEAHLATALGQARDSLPAASLHQSERDASACMRRHQAFALLSPWPPSLYLSGYPNLYVIPWCVASNLGANVPLYITS